MPIVVRPSRVESLRYSRWQHARRWAFAILAALAVLVIGLAGMGWMGWFDQTCDKDTTCFLAKSIGLVGTLLTSALTLLGTVLKFSLDERNFTLSTHESDRQRIETMLKAAELLGADSKTSDAEALRNSNVRKAGAVLSLSYLDEHDMAIAMLRQVWQRETNPDGTPAPVERYGAAAYIVFRRAFGLGNEETKISASSLLSDMGQRIHQGDAHIWPFPEDGWPGAGTLPGNASIGLIRAAVKWAAAELADGSSRPTALYALWMAMRAGTQTVREIAATAVYAIVPVGVDQGATIASFDFATQITMQDLLGEAAKVYGEKQGWDPSELMPYRWMSKPDGSPLSAMSENVDHFHDPGRDWVLGAIRNAVIDGLLGGPDPQPEASDQAAESAGATPPDDGT